MIYVFLANGFEEIEALATIDVLRRAELSVTTVGIGGKQITGAHHITVAADVEENDVQFAEMSAVVLPGGMPGTLNLEASKIVQEALEHAVKNNLVIAAICAAPSILGHKGLLKGKQAIAYPGFEKELTDAIVSDSAVVRDGNIITGKGAGVAIDFGLEIVRALVSDKTANTVKEAMQCK